MTNANSGNEIEIKEMTTDDVAQARAVPKDTELPALTKVGYKLALFLLIYLSVVSAILLVEYLWNAPSFPDVATLDDTKLKHYEQLSQITTDRTVKLLDTLVLKGFLPVLTAVLGYIFGTHGADKED